MNIMIRYFIDRLIHYRPPIFIYIYHLQISKTYIFQYQNLGTKYFSLSNINF